jgi:GNAT superfamily N-acetyltransferase
MAAELTAIPACTDDRVSLTADVPEYGPRGPASADARAGPPRDRLPAVACVDGAFGGRAWSFATGAHAGVYDMDVWPVFRRRGLGRALLRVVCSAARTAGAQFATLNATAEGEPLYAAEGFARLGEGITTGTTCAETDQAVPRGCAFDDLVAHDAFGIQLLGPGYTSRLTLGADWRARPAGSDATLVEHVDTDAWFQAPRSPRCQRTGDGIAAATYPSQTSWSPHGPTSHRSSTRRASSHSFAFRKRRGSRTATGQRCPDCRLGRCRQRRPSAAMRGEATVDRDRRGVAGVHGVDDCRSFRCYAGDRGDPEICVGRAGVG